MRPLARVRGNLPPGSTNNSRAPGAAPWVFPVRVYGRLRPFATQVARHLCEDTLAIAFPGKQRLGTDGEDDSNNLQVHREAERVELSNRPRQDLGHVVDCLPQLVFDLLRRRPMPPSAREIGDARHAGEGDNAAVVGADAELALSLERRACRRLAYVAASR
jgi:hypothetical protein